MSDEKRQRPEDSHPADAHAEAFDQVSDEGESTIPFETLGDSAMNAEQLVEKLRNDVALADERVLRTQAEFENFRKRTRRDYEDQLRYANVPLLRDSLEVLDNLRRAIASAANNEQASGLRDGVELVAKQLESVMAKYQCRPIPSVGEPFDPNFHEAISQMPSNDHAAGFVAHEVLPGFQLGERVIRPSQVIVSTGPTPLES